MTEKPVILRDYLYLDTERLQNYLSSLDPGVIQEVRQRVTSSRDSETGGGFHVAAVSVGHSRQSGASTEEEMTLRVTSQHLFHRVYEELKKREQIEIFAETDPIDSQRAEKRTVVEIARPFSPSPLSEMVRSMFETVRLLEDLGIAQERLDPTTKQMLKQMAMVFRHDQMNQELPMVSRAEGTEASVVFLVKTQFLQVELDAFDGDMTVFGKVEKQIPAGQSLDLFDSMNVIPKGLRRSSGTSDLREALISVFTSWPEQLGGPLDPTSVNIPGPVIVVSPLAVYT